MYFEEEMYNQTSDHFDAYLNEVISIIRNGLVNENVPLEKSPGLKMSRGLANCVVSVGNDGCFCSIKRQI